jgi:uncharacterized protein (TIGR00730 family)
MKVCVCGGTNPKTNAKFLVSVEEIGKLFCDNDIELVWGGNLHGVLSVIYKEYVRRSKPNTLVVPKVYIDDLKNMKTDKVVVTDTISQRTDAMFAAADAIVFVPGGVGTIYEFWSAVETLRAREHKAKIFLFNYNGFYKTQIKFFEFINENGFTETGKGSPYKIKPESLFTVVKTPKELLAKLQELTR